MLQLPRNAFAIGLSMLLALASAVAVHAGSPLARHGEDTRVEIRQMFRQPLQTAESPMHTLIARFLHIPVSPAP